MLHIESLLATYEVEFFQGFMFGRPMSADDVEARIRDDQADNGFYLRAA